MTHSTFIQRIGLKILATLIVVCSVSTLSAQEKGWLHLFGGADFNSLLPPNDSIKTYHSVMPFGGLSLVVPIDKNELHLGSTLFKKSSRDDSKKKYQNMGLSAFVNYNYKVSDKFSISAGPQYSFVINSYVKRGSESTNMPGYNAYFSLNAGVLFELQPNINLGLSYEYPFNTKLEKWPSLKVTVALKLSKKSLKIDHRKAAEQHAGKELKNMQNAVLLVRLRSYKKQIEIYQDKGLFDRVEQIKKERDARNHKIMLAFEEAFDYCPVYFFYNSDTEKIKNKNFSNVFINRQMKLDSSIVIHPKDYYIGEFGYHNAYTENMDYSQQEASDSHLNRATDFSNYGFVIMDSQFKMLPKPFPSFTMGYFAFVKRKPAKILKRANQKLKKLR